MERAAVFQLPLAGPFRTSSCPWDLSVHKIKRCNALLMELLYKNSKSERIVQQLSSTHLDKILSFQILRRRERQSFTQKGCIAPTNLALLE